MYTLGLPVPAVDGRQGDRRRAVDPATTSRETARENGIERNIRFGHKVVRAEWSSDRRALDRATPSAPTPARPSQFTCRFLFMCSGYYRYDQGYTPEFAGIERFQGQIVHPQHWPEDLDYAGKRVVVIGSGATAVTLVPAMAETAAHVTMLQRSPTYIVSLPAEDPLADWLRRVLPARRRLHGHALEERAARRCSATSSAGAGRELMKRLIRAGRASASCRRATTSTRTSSRATTRGTSACAWCPTATCSSAIWRRQRVGRHRPDRDVHRDRASGWSPATSSRPTSSSPRPG